VGNLVAAVVRARVAAGLRWWGAGRARGGRRREDDGVGRGRTAATRRVGRGWTGGPVATYRAGGRKQVKGEKERRREKRAAGGGILTFFAECLRSGTRQIFF
jgi:hypothetical protein